MSALNPDSVVILITGGNTGIGFGIASRLAKELPKSHVIIGSRVAAAGEAAASSLASLGHSVSSVQLDLRSDESIAAAVKHIETNYGRLDVLINNAGVLLDGFEPQWTTRQLFTETFSTNVFGTATVTEECLPLLKLSKLPRIIFISSRMGSLSEATNKETIFYAADYKVYDASKAAVNILALNYARILEEHGGLVNVVCPGLVDTKLLRGMPGGAPPEVGAQRVVEIVLAGKDGPSATFSDKNGPVPW